jgi:peptidoglycan/LPS O-acetylase OafA/YrhL
MDAVSGLGVSGVITGLAGLERARPLRRSRVARLLGAMSYPLYILHGSLMLMFSVAFGSWLRLGAAGLYALAIGGLVAIYAICAVVTFGFDQPLQRVLKGKKAVLI